MRPDPEQAVYDRGRGVHREVSQHVNGIYSNLPAWGFLEAIELVLRQPLPNMNAARPFQLFVSLRDGDGNYVADFDVVVHSRNVA